MWIPERGTIWLNRLYREGRSSLITETRPAQWITAAEGRKHFIEVIYKCCKDRAGPKIIYNLLKLKDIFIPEHRNKQVETPEWVWEVWEGSRKGRLLFSIATLCSAERVHLRAARRQKGQVSHANALKEGLFVHVLLVAALTGHDLSL